MSPVVNRDLGPCVLTWDPNGDNIDFTFTHGGIGFFFNTSEFDRNFQKVTKDVIPPSAEKGLFNAAAELIHDSKSEPPQAPRDIGDLWGSGIVQKPKSSPSEISVKCGFTEKYAHRHHEVPPGTYKYTITPGVCDQPGPKFMESKMIKNKEKYIKIVAETIKDSRL